MTPEYYTNLWQNWIAEIEKTVPKTNKAFNLKQGISDSDIKMNQSQIAVNLPEDLIDFYRANNVTDNADISVFQFDIKGCWYNLLPFNQIPVEWNDFFEFDANEVQSNYKSAGISDKIIANDFANPNWIPFAVTDQGDMLLFDTQPSKKGVYGQIIELQNDSWERNVVANNLTELIKNQIEKLQNGEREIIETWLEKEAETENSLKKYFEFKDEKSSKFWEITLENASLKTRYGKIGTAGQISEKQFENELSAEKEYNKLIAEKTKKGYAEIKNTETQTAENEDNTALKIIFPNSFTTGKSKTENIENLQNQFNFSNEYANFLNIQNGFDGYDFDDASDKKRQKYLQKTTIELPDYYLNDIKNLYSSEELIEENKDNIFRDYLLMIGVDKGGNNFVEVLHGQFKGYIGFIDHEMYAGSDNMEEFIETFSLENFEKSTLEERTDMLCDEDIMMQFYAKNMHDFIENCIIFVNGEVKVIELEKIR